MDLWSCQELAQETQQASESLLLGFPHGLTLHVKEKRLSTLPPNHLASSEARDPLFPWLSSQPRISCQSIYPNSKCSAEVKVKGLVAQSCLTLCDPMDCSLPSSSVHGISPARILEWVAISFSTGSSQPRGQTQASCIAGIFITV